MSHYDNNFVAPNNMNQQRDLVLSINEFCFLQNKTNGMIKTNVGPMTTTISGQEALVTFNAKTKRFEETTNFEKAKQLFTSAPEGWYVILKNPTSDNHYPEIGKANSIPSSITVGRKVKHKVFGIGTVVAVADANGDKKLTIAFNSQGIKNLMQSIAKLELL